jgi:hypothetical protein
MKLFSIAAALLLLGCSTEAPVFGNGPGEGGAGGDDPAGVGGASSSTGEGGASSTVTSSATVGGAGGQGGSSSTGGAGGEPECIQAVDCPGEVSDCAGPACVEGKCEYLNAPYGKPLQVQIDYDCSIEICDGEGGHFFISDESDIPFDGNACTHDVCAGNVIQHPPTDAGTACNVGAAKVCDGAGKCAECADEFDCVFNGGSGICGANGLCVCQETSEFTCPVGQTPMHCGKGADSLSAPGCTFVGLAVNSSAWCCPS